MTVHDPIRPGPDAAKHAVPDRVPGEIIPADGRIELSPGRRRATLRALNTGDRPIQVGSHFHFFEVNRALEFDRALAWGMHLD
ncbi:urease subunit beta, partial [Parvimonas sp. D2]